MLVFWVAHKWREVTGGEDGLRGIPRPPLELLGLSIDLRPLAHFYYFVLIISLISIYILYRIANSPFGLALQGIRYSATRSALIGIAVWKYRLLCFVISAFFTGLAGSITAPLEGIVTPAHAHWTHSGLMVLACLFGGIYNFWGPAIGAVLLYIIKDYVMRWTVYWLLVFGVIILIFVNFCRGGIVELLQRIALRIRPMGVQSG